MSPNEISLSSCHPQELARDGRRWRAVGLPNGGGGGGEDGGDGDNGGDRDDGGDGGVHVDCSGGGG